MAIQVKDANDATMNLKGTGAGSSGDPFIPEHKETNSGTISSTLTTISTAIASILTGIQTIAGAITASVMQIAGTVTIGAAIPAGANAIGSVDINTLPMPTAIFNNKVTVATAGTKVQLIVSSTPIKSGAKVKALSGNSGNIYLGNSTVSSSNGFLLAPGEEQFIEIDNLNKIYIDASANAQSVYYIGS